MRSHRLRSRTAHSALRPGSGVSIGDIAIRIVPPGARAASTRAALLGSVCIGALAMLVPETAHAVDGNWQGPGSGVDHRHQLELQSDCARWNGDVHQQRRPTSVTISNTTSINTIAFDRRGAGLFVHRSERGITFTVNNSSSSTSNFNVSSGATLAIGNEARSRSARWRAPAPCSSARPIRTLLFISGNTSTTFSGVISGPGSIELDDAASLRLTGSGSVIGGDLDLCLCSTGSLTIDGGSLTVNGLAQGVTVEGGTLSVINGATLQVGDTPAANDLLVASNMIISGAGSSVTVNGFTGIGIFGPATVSISSGGVLNSQGGAEIDSILGTPTATVTGPGSTWNVGGSGLSVGGGGTGGPGMLTISNGGVVNSATSTTIGDVADGSSNVVVTGAGSVLNASNSLAIGGPGCGCGPLVGTLTVANGGVVNSSGFTGIAQGSTLNLGTGGLAGAINTPAIANDGQIVANFTDTLTLAAAISGTGTLSKAGAGTLTLTGNSSYSGATTVNAGTVSVNGSIANSA